MIGVIIPAHDEERLIGRCLDAIRAAAAHPELNGEEVFVLVVLDACRDATRQVAERHGVACLEIEARNVGAARATGANALVARGARWLAFTDADTVVSASWLARQIALRADAVCGVVAVDDWSEFSHEARTAYEAGYVDAEHHRHIHGANLGVATSAYVRVGGFLPLRTSEDVDLVHRLSTIGSVISWTNTVRVQTSARRVGRAPAGFAAFLRALPDGPPARGIAA